MLTRFIVEEYTPLYLSIEEGNDEIIKLTLI